MKNERYELELSGGNGTQISEQLVEIMSQASNNKHSEAEFAGISSTLLFQIISPVALRSELQNLVRVNDGLQSSLMRMQV